MKLRELLTASVAAIALAGVASANETEFDIGGVVVGTAGTTGLAIASEMDGDLAAVPATIIVRPSAGDYPDNTNVVVRFELSGAQFNDTANVALTAANNGGGACAVAGAIASVTALGATEAAFLVSDPLECEFSLDTGGLDIANGNSVSVTASVETEAGTGVGGGETTRNLISGFEAAFAASVVDNDKLAELSDFTTLSGNPFTLALADTAGGQYGYETNTNTLFVLDVAGLDSNSADATVSGTFAGIDTVGGETPAAGEVALTGLTLDATPAWAPEGTDAIVGGSYTVVGTVTLTEANTALQDLAVSGSFTIGREGTNLKFVDTLDDDLSQQYSAVNRYRISNSGDSPAGRVSVQLLTSSEDGFTVPAGMFELASEIPAQGEVVFFPADIQAQVGAYGVGDFILVVEADDANLEGTYTQISNGGVTNFPVQ